MQVTVHTANTIHTLCKAKGKNWQDASFNRCSSLLKPKIRKCSVFNTGIGSFVIIVMSDVLFNDKIHATILNYNNIIIIINKKAVNLAFNIFEYHYIR